MFSLVAQYSQQLVMPVGLLYEHATTNNLSMYEDSITLLLSHKHDATISPEFNTFDCFKRLYHSVNSLTTVHMLHIKKAMLIACMNNHIEVVRFLVNQGFQLNQTTVWSKSPLYVACEQGHVELATYLIGRFEIDVNL